MYLRQIRLIDIKGFRDLTLNFAAPAKKTGSWHVIIGENGTGKSTLLRAIALALAGRERAAGLLPDAAGWVSDGRMEGSCQAVVAFDHPDQTTEVTYKLNSRPFEDPEHGFVSRPSVLFSKVSSSLARQLYLPGNGYLLAGYGPFRHLAAPTMAHRSPSSYDDPFFSLFAPVPLTECEEWLKRLDYRRKTATGQEQKAADNAFRAALGVLNRLLPKPYRIEKVGPEGVVFTGPAATLTLSDLSDGYRTMFGLGVDMLRRIFDSVDTFARGDLRAYADGGYSLETAGVVLIDEPESHLHPKWQREVGFYLRQAFPKIQFIVATHSPFVAQAASPDGIFVMRRDSQSGVVTADDSLDSFQGWRADQILDRAFGLQSTRDVETDRLMRRHEALRGRQLSGLELSEAEQRELDKLTRQLERLLPGSTKQAEEQDV